MCWLSCKHHGNFLMRPDNKDIDVDKDCCGYESRETSFLRMIRGLNCTKITLSKPLFTARNAHFNN